MLSDDKRKKLEELAGKLGKKKLQFGSDWAAQANISEKSSNNTKFKANSKDDRQPKVKLEDALEGQEAKTPVGTYFLIRRNLSTNWPESTEIRSLYKQVFTENDVAIEIDEKNQDLTALLKADPRKITYLDIETCGFSGTMIFLIGWCYFDGNDDIIVEQALARNYAEESAMIYAACERLMETQVIVSFNGKRFDMPSINERAIVNRQVAPPVLSHLDLLDQVRARWKKQLPNCKLQTVETILCQRPRTGDIHGSAIPQAYHDFVKTEDARKLKTIIHHNFLDVVTLAEITARLLSGQSPNDFQDEFSQL
jgi:uncharacterized protein YprB with RNaseH-like and TPR domain